MPGVEWDVGAHLPLWVSANEKHQIEQRIDGWVAQLLQVRDLWREIEILFV